MTGRSDSDVTQDPVRRYLREIGMHALLTAEEEGVLGRAVRDGRIAEERLAAGRAATARTGTAGRARAGAARAAAHRGVDDDDAELHALAEAGRDARRRFIQGNLRLVVSIAKRYQSCGLPLLDLVQEGNLGLIRAVEKFEPERGCKFSTYATWWIRQAIARAIADKGRTIRVPVHMLDTVRRVERATTTLREQNGGNEPTVDAVAAMAGVSADTVRDARDVLPDPISLQAPVGDEDGELGDLLADRTEDAPYELAWASYAQSSVQSALDRLSARERDVLRLRFGLAGNEPQTLEQVGRSFRLTRERIRQIEAKAMSKLRHPTSPPGLRALGAHGGARQAPQPDPSPSQAVSWA